MERNLKNYFIRQWNYSQAAAITGKRIDSLCSTSWSYHDLSCVLNAFASKGLQRHIVHRNITMLKWQQTPAKG